MTPCSLYRRPCGNHWMFELDEAKQRGETQQGTRCSINGAWQWCLTRFDLWKEAKLALCGQSKTYGKHSEGVPMRCWTPS